MKIVFIGCVEFSHKALDSLLNIPEANVVGVVTRKKSKFNSDFSDLQPLAESANCPCFYASGNNQTEIEQWIKELHPDVIYCFGWSYLLRSSLLQAAPLGVVGYHPAALPKNRGRHPLIWALALGLKKTASTFFFMDEGADSGDVLDQEEIEINDKDYASDLYAKMCETALHQIQRFTKDLARNQFTRTPQDHSQSNYWRKRGIADGQIDWRMSSHNIRNLVRALAKPYPGAHCMSDGNMVKVWKCDIANDDIENAEPGKIIEVIDHVIKVKCGEGTLLLTDHEFDHLPTQDTYL